MRCQHCKKKLREGQIVLPLLEVAEKFYHDQWKITNWIHITCIERRYYDH